MASPLEQLQRDLDAWLAHDARERIARARADPDADSALAVARRHAGLRGPRTRERFEEARERGLLLGDALTHVTALLRDAHASVGRALAEQRVRAALATRVPHDSDHHTPLELAHRLATEAHEGRRRAFARSLSDFAPTLTRALRDGEADVEESLDGASWLGAGSSAESEEAGGEAARSMLDATEDAWDECRERVAHGRARLDTWADLAFVLRAPHFDDLASPRRRWMRVADRLAGLGVRDALTRRVRVEGVAEPARPSASVVALDVPRDLRILPATIELGLASERDASEALGRALGLAWTHPALPRPEKTGGTVGFAVGALFAHLLTERGFAWPELSEAERRRARELAVLLELFALRTGAAVVLARAHRRDSLFSDAAREPLREAWRVDVDASVAECIACVEPGDRVSAARWAPALHVALRELYDEDWWRNPRAGEAIRVACERGARLGVEAWAKEIDAEPSALGPRFVELLG